VKAENPASVPATPPPDTTRGFCIYYRNGILRRYFPKGHDWRLTTQKELDRVVRRINATPMKCLGYKTPAGIFAKYAGVALVS
jgi:hypothetical protein